MSALRILLLIAACAALPATAVVAMRAAGPAAGSKYVALGSSFAAGPAIGMAAPGAPTRCGQSSENYAHLVAKSRQLVLVDVTCSGATTQHILGPWNELPPQIDAVDDNTKLVSITVGGNDLNYIGLLLAYACRAAATARSDKTSESHCPAATQPTAQSYRTLETGLRGIAAEVRRRAPDATLIFVQYPPILPRHGTCAATFLSPDEADVARHIARILAATTRRIAHEANARILTVNRQLAGHALCSAQPWINPFGSPFHHDGIFFHPDRASMSAQASALERLVWGDTTQMAAP